jgi:biopolymer transport protein ExbD
MPRQPIRGPAAAFQPAEVRFMAGVDTVQGPGKRKTLDSEINMIPMIDLLMVTISFLLITAVWTHMARLEASANVPAPRDHACDGPECEPEKELHVDMRAPDRFVLSWRLKGLITSSRDVPRRETGRFDDLATAMEKEWTGQGMHRAPTDAARDRAVLHVNNGATYDDMIAAMDAMQKPQRERRAARAHGLADGATVPAFTVTLAVD